LIVAAHQVALHRFKGRKEVAANLERFGGQCFFFFFVAILLDHYPH
jgi:hypothetical protein